MAHDRWDKTDIVVKAISAILLPFALLLVGHCQEIALHDPSAEVAKAAGGALYATAKGTPALADEIHQSVAQEAARVYLEISSEAQRALAKRLATTLAASGYSVPGIEIVEVPPEHTQVRFFHAADKPLAEDVGQRLGEFGLRDVQLELVGGDQDRAPHKQFEVWLGAVLRPN